MSIYKLLTTTVVAGVLALSISTTANALVITSFVDDFSADAGGTYLTIPNPNLTNWDVTDGTVDVLSLSYFGGLCAAAGGAVNCVDLDGSSNDAGVLTTKDEFLAGEYLVSFDLAGSQRGGSDSVEVNFGGISLGTFILASADPFTTISQTITILANGKLSFSDLGNDNIGALLDNVSVSLVSAVPVPAALPLFGTGLAVLGFMGWRRKRKAA